MLPVLKKHMPIQAINASVVLRGVNRALAAPFANHVLNKDSFLIINAWKNVLTDFMVMKIKYVHFALVIALNVRIKINVPLVIISLLLKLKMLVSVKMVFI